MLAWGGGEARSVTGSLSACFVLFFRVISLIFSIAGFVSISLFNHLKLFFLFSRSLFLPHSLSSFYPSVTQCGALLDGHRSRKLTKIQFLLFAIVCDGNNAYAKREKGSFAFRQELSLVLPILSDHRQDSLNTYLIHG